jgi:hypothetical protein
MKKGENYSYRKQSFLANLEYEGSSKPPRKANRGVSAMHEDFKKEEFFL